MPRIAVRLFAQSGSQLLTPTTVAIHFQFDNPPTQAQLLHRGRVHPGALAMRVRRTCTADELVSVIGPWLSGHPGTCVWTTPELVLPSGTGVGGRHRTLYIGQLAVADANVESFKAEARPALTSRSRHPDRAKTDRGLRGVQTTASLVSRGSPHPSDDGHEVMHPCGWRTVAWKVEPVRICGHI